MASLDQLKLTFFDECSEALQQIELGLPEIADGAGAEDTINAVFRSVHSVKGGAGIFGFEDLVKFAHVFETVLDAMRSGKLATTHEIVDTLLQANDVLTDLIAMSRSGEAVAPDFGAECRAALEQILRKNSDGEELGEGMDPAPADFEGLDFIPVRVEEFESPDSQGAEQEYRIVFRPKPDMLKKANEPLYILRELRKLGSLDLIVETDRLPALADMKATESYLGWVGILRTAATRQQIDDVFEFVAGDCDLEISSVPAEPMGSAQAAEMDLPLSSAAAAPVPALSESAPPIAASLPGVEPPGVAPPHERPAAPSAVKAAGNASETAAPQGAPSKAPAAAATTTRVELEKIDRVVNMVGELVIAQAMLGQVVHTLPEDVSGRLMQVLDEVVHHTRELKDSVMSMRAQQVNAVFQRMPRLVRELATKTAKKSASKLPGKPPRSTARSSSGLAIRSRTLFAIRSIMASRLPRIAQRQASPKKARYACRPSTVAAASSSKFGTTAQASIPNGFCKRPANAVWSLRRLFSTRTRSTISYSCRDFPPRRRFPTFRAAVSAWTSCAATFRTSAAAFR